MPKRKCNIDDDMQQIQDTDIPLELPVTPGRCNKKRRRDVIDSMGEQRGELVDSPGNSSHGLNSPAIAANAPSPSFATPQRARATTYWNTATSPDQGYSSTPELVRTYTSGWAGKKVDAHDASVVTADDEDDYSFSPVEPIAEMSTQRDANHYNMEHRNRGKCIIFNHENFDTGFETREGSSMDAQRIEQTFQRLGFTVEICHDYEHSNLINKITELSEEDHTDNDCICFFVLTHGLKNDFICAKDVVYKLDNIWKPFTAERCSTLAGKPKLFFFQACRGDSLDAGVIMQRSGSTQTDSSYTSYKIPTHADFLFAHSTTQGFYSWRNREEGTWYIQSLCDIIDEYASTTDLVKMLTMTARKVATEYTSFNDLDPGLHGQTQVPSVTSMLIRDLYFTLKNE